MAIEKTSSSSSLVEVIDRILDKGIVVDIWARVSLVGLEILTIEARIVIASVETYLKYAEAIGLTQSAAIPRISDKDEEKKSQKRMALKKAETLIPDF